MSFAKRFLAPILLAFGLLVAGAACGGSDKAASPTTTAKAASSTTEGGSGSSTPANAGDPSATSTPAGGGTTTTVVASDPDSAFCVTVKRLNDNHSLDPATIAQPEGPERLQKAFAELEAKAPASLKPSIRIVAHAIDEIAKADAKTREELDSINSKISQEQVAAASNRLETYVKKTCGVDLGG